MVAEWTNLLVELVSLNMLKHWYNFKYTYSKLKTFLWIVQILVISFSG